MAEYSNVIIEPAPIYQQTERDFVIIRHRDAWRRVVAVCNQPRDCRIFLEVARIRQRGIQNTCMNVCELVGKSAIGSHDAASTSQLLSDTSLQVVPWINATRVGKLQWTTVAYRRPKPGKQYQRLPETVLIGSPRGTELSTRLCCSRSMLGNAGYKTELDTFCIPLYAALHGQTSAMVKTTWAPCPTRQYSNELETRIRISLEALGARLGTYHGSASCLAREGLSIRDLTDGDVHIMGTEEIENRTNGILPPSGKSPVDEQNEKQEWVVAEDLRLQDFQGKAEAVIDTRLDVNARCDRRPQKQCADDAGSASLRHQYTIAAVHATDTINTSAVVGIHSSRKIGPECLPQDIVFMILDYLPKSHTPTSAFYLARKPTNALSQTCRYFRYCWFQYRPLHIYVRKWSWEPETELDLTPLQVRLLRSASRIVIDFAYVKYWRLKEAHPVASQLADILARSEQLEIVEFLVPPAFDDLPALNPAPDVDVILKPILTILDPHKFRWNPRCFLGSSHRGELMLHTAVLFGDYSRTKAILPHVHSGVNSRGFFVSPPLLLATHQKDVEMVKLLLTVEEIDVNVEESGLTPLHYAVLANHEALVRTLIGSGKADVHRRIGPQTMYQRAEKHCSESNVLLIESAMNLPSPDDASRNWSDEESEDWLG